MNNLKKFNSQENYINFQLFDKNSLNTNVYLINGKVKYHNPDSEFYLEAVEDLILSTNISKQNVLYSLDCKNWIDTKNSNITLCSGQRVYLKAQSSVSKTNITISGNFKLGGCYDSYFNSAFASNSNLISVEDVNFETTGANFSGCENLTIIPQHAYYNTSAFCYSYTSKVPTFNDNVEGKISIFPINLTPYSGIKIDISNTKIDTVIMNGCDYNSKPGNCQGSGDDISIKLPNLSGKFIIDDRWLRRWSFANMNSWLPELWELKLYNSNTNSCYVQFYIGTTTYTADDNMTWEQWVNSDYNTGKFKVESGNVVSTGGIVYLGELAVSSSDVIKCTGGTNYSIGSLESENQEE